MANKALFCFIIVLVLGLIAYVGYGTISGTIARIGFFAALAGLAVVLPFALTKGLPKGRRTPQ